MLGGAMEWKTIPGFSLYEISNTGLIRRSVKFDHKGKPGRRQKPGQTLKLNTGGAHYLSATLASDDGYIGRVHSHRLVAIAFIGPPPFKGAKVLHKDDNKLNNSVENLYWGSTTDNYNDARRNGRIKRPGNARFTDDEVKEIRSLNKQGYSGYRIAKELNVDQTVIYDLLRGTSYGDV